MWYVPICKGQSSCVSCLHRNLTLDIFLDTICAFFFFLLFFFHDHNVQLALFSFIFFFFRADLRACEGLKEQKTLFHFVFLNLLFFPFFSPSGPTFSGHNVCNSHQPQPTWSWPSFCSFNGFYHPQPNVLLAQRLSCFIFVCFSFCWCFW